MLQAVSLKNPFVHEHWTGVSSRQAQRAQSCRRQRPLAIITARSPLFAGTPTSTPPPNVLKVESTI